MFFLFDYYIVFGIGLFIHYYLFLRLFCRMRNRSLVSEREFTRLVGRSVDPWVVNFCLYFR